MKRNSKTQDFKNLIFDFRDLTCLGLQLYIMLLGIVVNELLKICSSLTSTPIKVEQSTTDLFILVNRILYYILFWITHPTKYIWVHYPKEKNVWKRNAILARRRYLLYRLFGVPDFAFLCACKFADVVCDFFLGFLDLQLISYNLL